MILLFILIYMLTLAYLALTIRVKRYIYLLSVQGALLFGITFFQLQHLDWPHLTFIVVETFIVKALVIPIFMNRIRKRNHLHRLSESQVPTFFSVLIIAGVIVGSFIIGHFIVDDHVQVQFFSIGASSILTGLFFVIAHRSIFNHLIGYLIIENGIFLLSLAVGAEMPLLVNTTIMLDVVVGVLALGMFINKLKDQFTEIHTDQLSKIKD